MTKCRDQGKPGSGISPAHPGSLQALLSLFYRELDNITLGKGFKGSILDHMGLKKHIVLIFRGNKTVGILNK